MKIKTVFIIGCCLIYSTVLSQTSYFKKQGNFQNINTADILSTMQKLDSVIHIDTGLYRIKESYSYDEKGNVVIIQYQYNETGGGQWINGGKKEIEYDSRNFIISETERYGVNASKFEYTYDVKGNLITYITSYLESGTWLDYKKTEFIYDERSNLIFETIYEWNSWLEHWKRLWKYELSYNDSDLLSESSSYEWVAGSDIWKIFGRNKYTYDDDLNKIEKLRLLWSDETNYWINNEKYSYQYDTSGNLRVEIDTYWNKSTNQWVNKKKYKYLYDNKNRMIEDINYVWSGIIDDWQVGSRFQYIYDQFGNRTKRIETALSGNEWFNVVKSENTYNNDYSKADLILPYYDYPDRDTLFTHMLTGLKNFVWNKTSRSWVNISFEELYYSDITFFGTEENYDLGIKIFPNPASNTICLNYNFTHNCLRFAIYDTYGRLLKQGELSNTGTDNISIYDLNKGMHVIRIFEQNNVLAIKFLKI